MSIYNNICDFLAKADYEGGLGDFIVGYGVDPENLGDELYPLAAPISRLKLAFTNLENAIKLLKEDKECINE